LKTGVFAHDDTVDAESISAIGVNWLRLVRKMDEGRAAIDPALQIFLGCQWTWCPGIEVDGSKWFQTTELVIKRLPSQFAIVEHMGTLPGSYDLDTHDVVDVLIRLNNKYGLETVGAMRDVVRVRLADPAKVDCRELGTELESFCPDVIDQGYQTMANLVGALQNQNVVTLWWD